jgi:Methyltransferase domain
LNAFLRYGCRCVGVEHPDYPEERLLNPDQITYLRSDATLETLPLNRFDLIFLWHAIEHVQNPMALMRRLRGLLSENGLMIMAAPNFGSSEAFAFKENWFHLDVPYHRFHFSESALRGLATSAGLRVTRSSEFCLEQGPYGLIQSTLNAMGWRFNECYEALKGNLNPRRIPQLGCQLVIGLFLAIPGLLLAALQAKEGKGAVLKMILRKGDGPPPRAKG